MKPGRTLKTHPHSHRKAGLKAASSTKTICLDLGSAVLGRDPKDYAQIEASVTTGALESGALGISKGGLFRSYKSAGPGKYKLSAHVGTGEIDLR
jgi:hypothetical protein